MEKEYGTLTKLEMQLVEEMEQISVIDCHEHLVSEEQRTGKEVDVFTLFSHYTRHDLINSGMPAEKYNMLHDKSIPLEVRWSIFEPYWENIRYSSYSRSALIAARKFYGADDIDVTTYKELTEKIKEANKPGLYRKILKEACNIELSLVQVGFSFKDLDRDFFVPVAHLTFFDFPCGWEIMSRPFFHLEGDLNTLDDYLWAVEKFIAKSKAEGAAGLKLPVREMNEPWISLGQGDPDAWKGISQCIAESVLDPYNSAEIC
jgi:hypothetical protein